MIHELNVTPQVTYSDTQGVTGVRKWTLDHNDNLSRFLTIVSNSHWPDRKDCIPIGIETGPFWDKVSLERDPDTNKRSHQTLGDLPKHGKILVTARYALHRIQNCWPSNLGPKPYHPPGTTLTIKTLGGGKDILASPPGIRNIPPGQAVCSDPSQAVTQGVLGRVVLCNTDYSLTCDRLTLDQLNGIFEQRHWDTYLGCVNYTDPIEGLDNLLACPQGTLLFEGYQLDETFVCHSDTPMRYRLTVHLKKRVVLEKDTLSEGGTAINTGGYLLAGSDYVGWNHDYVNLNASKRWDWLFITAFQDGECVPRYPYARMDRLFENVDHESLDAHYPGWDDCDDESETPEDLGDCDLCVSE